MSLEGDKEYRKLRDDFLLQEIKRLGKEEDREEREEDKIDISDRPTRCWPCLGGLFNWAIKQRRKFELRL